MVIAINTQPQDTVTRIVHCIPDEWKRGGFNEKLYGMARGCVNKNSYSSRRKARLAADARERVAGIKLGVYHCSHCGMYHMTSKRFKEVA